MSFEDVASRIKSALVPYPDFPKPGIIFQDVFPVFRDWELTKDLAKCIVRMPLGLD